METFANTGRMMRSSYDQNPLPQHGKEGRPGARAAVAVRTLPKNVDVEIEAIARVG